jgi:hypothetical protein
MGRRKSAPPKRSGLENVWLAKRAGERRLRRRTAARATKPLPKIRAVLGSGMGVYS